MLSIPVVNQWNVNASVTMMVVQFANRCYKLVCCRNKTDRNARKSGSKRTLVNAILHFISGDRLQKVNTQNLKYQYITHFCV